MTSDELIKWMINNLLTESQLDVVPPGSTASLRHYTVERAPLYTITIVDAEALAAFQDGGEGPQLYGGKTFKNFTKIASGAYVGGYRGIADGDEVIFEAEEVANATIQS